MNLTKPVSAPFEHSRLDWVIGVGLVWVYLSAAAFVVLDYSFTALGFGTALAHLAIPTFIVVGVIHEFFGHKVVAEFLGYEAEFVALRQTLRLSLASIGVVIVMVLVDGFTSVSLPSWILLFTAASPGAVIVGGRYEKASPTISLVAPVLNFLTGAGLWYVGTTSPSPTMDFMTAAPGWVLTLSLLFGFMNSIPLWNFDGAKAWRGSILHKTTVVITLIGSGWILIS
ncbi:MULTISPECIES: hypothetical protein [Haloarcula]|uniref:hypothetical protein n=1 Tax=Haloarcula TaxID=2237 RepID=UPI0023E7A88E|nr:hypothetical protein [Halomicroarcula sp. SHR3]